MSHFTPDPDAPDRDAIAVLAYQLWQQRGCPEGSGEEDWARAEALLRADALRQQRQAEAAPTPDLAAAADPLPRKTPRAAKALKLAGESSARKTRVSRARPARPDA